MTNGGDATETDFIGKRLVCPDGSSLTFENLMGVGGSGTVYRCKYECSGRRPEQVAAKVVDVRGLRLSGTYERERDKLRREIAILASLSHEGVVNLHGVLDTMDRLILIMDLVEGGELFSYVASRGCLTEDQARYVFSQLAQTLVFLHSEGVIHRDLKLENILVSKEVADGYYNVRIADFGLSKIIAGNYTIAKSYVGTPQYWAPEVITGGTSKMDPGYSFPADIWSLGCVLYVLVAGTYPFDEGEDAILSGNFHFKYPRFSGISDACKSLIEKMLRVNPKERITLLEILNNPWVNQVDPTGLVPPRLTQTVRKPIMLNVGPTIVGAKPQTAIMEYKGATAPLNPGPYPRSDSVFNLVNKFCDASTLLRCLARVFYGFHKAYLIFRCHAELAPQFELFLTAYKDIVRDTHKTFKKFAGTCVSVLETLQDISDVLDIEKPQLAWELFATLKDWTSETVEDGYKMNTKFRQITNEAFRLIIYARDINGPKAANLPRDHKMLAILPTEHVLKAADDRVTEHDRTPVESISRVWSPVHSGSRNTTSSSFCRTGYTHEREALFQAVEACSAVDPTSEHPEASAAVCNRLLDFIFVSPEVVEGASSEVKPMMEHEPMDVDPSQQEMDVDLTKKTGPCMDQIAALLCGVKELQAINDMLEQCSAFWDNLDVTLDLLKKFRDQTEVLMQNGDSIERLRVRLNKYQSFWSEFHHQCQLFVDGSALQVATMTKFTNAFNETLVRLKHTTAGDLVAGITRSL